MLQQAQLPFLALTQLYGLESIIFCLQGLESIGHRTQLSLQFEVLVRPSAGFQSADSLIEMLNAMAIVTGFDGEPVAHQCQEPCQADLQKFQPAAGRKSPTDLSLTVGVGLGVGLEHTVGSDKAKLETISIKQPPSEAHGPFATWCSDGTWDQSHFGAIQRQVVNDTKPGAFPVEHLPFGATRVAVGLAAP